MFLVTYVTDFESQLKQFEQKKFTHISVIRFLNSIYNTNYSINIID